MTHEELKEIVEKHTKWLRREGGGSRADLSDADLSRADLSGADLSDADLIGADLSDADLSDAVLSGADLRGAVLSGADLSRADLSGADLSDADLSDIKSDFIAAILLLPDEIPFLRQAIVDGKIDGSSYTGECACLAGTMAHACGMKWGDFTKSQKFPIAANSPRERWFLGIRKGDTPENNQISAITLEWIDEALQMVDRIRVTA